MEWITLDAIKDWTCLFVNDPYDGINEWSMIFKDGNEWWVTYLTMFGVERYEDSTEDINKDENTTKDINKDEKLMDILYESELCRITGNPNAKLYRDTQ